MALFDALNLKILHALQQDATMPLEQLARKLGSSKTALWNRIRKLRGDGVIRQEVAILDPSKVGLNSCFYVLIRTAHHEAGWMERFVDALHQLPEVMEAHRMAGDIDYILKVRVKNAADYDRFYRELIANVDIYNVTSLLSMEALIDKTALPL